MNWIKENWFKLSTLILLLVIAVSAAGYFFHHMEEEKNFERRVACTEQVDKLRQRVPEVRRDYELIESNYNRGDENCYAYIFDPGGGTVVGTYIVYDAFRAEEVYKVRELLNNGQTKFSKQDISSTDGIDRAAKRIMYSHKN